VNELELVSKHTNVYGITEMYKWVTPSKKILYLLFQDRVLISFSEMPQ